MIDINHIQLSELIITCEACGNVKRYSVFSQRDCDEMIREFQCENNCGRNMYSFISVGTFIPSDNFFSNLASKEETMVYDDEMIIR